MDRGGAACGAFGIAFGAVGVGHRADLLWGRKAGMGTRSEADGSGRADGCWVSGSAARGRPGYGTGGSRACDVRIGSDGWIRGGDRRRTFRLPHDAWRTHDGRGHDWRIPAVAGDRTSLCGDESSARERSVSNGMAGPNGAEAGDPDADGLGTVVRNAPVSPFGRD